jgi:DNA-binding NtrC family response regulator
VVENGGSQGSQLLLLEDDASIRFPLSRYFRERGIAVIEATNCQEARGAIEASSPEVAVIDLNLPDGDGLDLLPELVGRDLPVATIVLTGNATIDRAVRAIQQGADHFLTKPVELAGLFQLVERLMTSAHDRRIHHALRRSARSAELDPFEGESAAMKALAHQARRVAEADRPVLIRGETGTGKGVLARWLHAQGARGREAFIDLNCAGLSRELFESELFGHARGAFTGAVEAKPGLFEVAHRGTLFLDEIGDLTLEIQPKLLKLLEEKQFRRLGEVRERRSDVRLLAATHRDLGVEVAEQRFRADLYYRIGAIELVVPPLRERGADVIALARRLLSLSGSDLGRPALAFSAEAESAIRARLWPGNIRELKNAIERAALFAVDSRITADLLAVGSESRGAGAQARQASSERTLDEAMRDHIESVFAHVGGDVLSAARTLGVSRATLYRYLSRYRIHV